MKRMSIATVALAFVAVALLAGCRGAPCGNCGYPYGGGYGGVPSQPPGTFVQPVVPGQGNTIVQPPPGMTGQPGVIIPQQVAPTQAQPGATYGGGTP